MTGTTVAVPLFLWSILIAIAVTPTKTSLIAANFSQRPTSEIEKFEKRLFYGWSEWSEWSGCSRTCGGGVRHKLRRCLGRECIGESAKQELCETNRCPENTVTFRQVQCSSFDNQIYRGRIFDRWIPAEDDQQEQCALLCRSQSHGFVVKLAPKAADGTECSVGGSGDAAVCVDGKCLAVGCDGVIGSVRRPDECGVCGGNGDSCGRPVFVWQETYQFSPCDRSCGSDSWRVSVSVCMNSKSQRVVPEKFCADKERPRPIIEQCLHVVCPEEQPVPAPKPGWLIGQWQDCNATCGGGWQFRDVYCAERHNDSSGSVENRKVEDKYCWQSKRPIDGRSCSTQQCPVWEAAEWSHCSVTCGKGVKMRKVDCRQERYKSLDRFACDPKTQPSSEQICYTGVSCAQAEENQLADYERYRYVASAPFTQWNDGAGGMDDMLNAGNGFAGPLGGGGMAQPRFFPGAWGSCSTSCGPGVRARSVECVAFQGITGGIMKLPEYECEGSPKPPLFEPCQLRQCPLSEPGNNAPDVVGQDVRPRGFRWEYGDWAACSASCLGGKQKSTLKCVEVAKNTPVAWSYCDPKQRPIDITRTCNNQPCPPSWETGPMSVCSHTCGGGLRTRKVRCTRKISKSGGAESTLILPDAQCPSPKPRDREPCGLADCPVQWRIEPWAPCSTSCGPGEQRRLVFCEQRSATGKLRHFNPPIECQSLDKPPTVQLCNLGSCPAPSPSTFENANKNFEQVGEHRRLTLRIGGKATLFEGTSVKVKCPVRNFERTRIVWTKDGHVLKPNDRVKISKFGALRIFKANAVDAGLYTCVADGVQGNVTLAFKPRTDNAQPKSNEVEEDVEADETNRVDSSDEKPAAVTAAETVNQVDVARPKPAELKDEDRAANGRALLQKLRDHLLQKGETKLHQALSKVDSSDVVRVEWALSDWTVCSTACDQEGGTQQRQVQCKVAAEGLFAYVDDEICIQFGISKPHASRACLNSHCPHWETAEWSDCDDSRCVRYSTGLQRRDINCVYDNGTRTDKEKCNKKTRPRIKKECFNRNCTAEWRAAPWGSCTRTCGDGGVQMRIIRCVWRGTKKAAGNNCQGADRPTVVRECDVKLDACPVNPAADGHGPFKGDSAQCMDDSRFCDVVKLFRSCDKPEYRQKCCLTCNFYFPQQSLTQK